MFSDLNFAGNETVTIIGCSSWKVGGNWQTCNPIKTSAMAMPNGHLSTLIAVKATEKQTKNKLTP